MFGSSFKFDDDDDFGDPSSTTILPKLFDISMEPEQQNTTLKYIPPKQQQTYEPNLSNANKSEWLTTIAKVVFAYKLVNQENIPQGKVGLAILRNNEDRYKLILYRTKQLILSTMSITTESKIYLKQQYLQYQDDEFVFWSLIFDGADRQLFLAEIKNKCCVEDESAADTVQPQKPKTIESNIASKSSILSRLAKMGKPLPELVSTASEVSDSSDTEPQKQVNHPRRTGNKILPVKSISQELIVDSVVATTSRHPIAQYNPNVQQDYGLNVFLSENRIQNTEIRLNLSKLENKIEKVLDKIDLFNTNERTENSKKSIGDREDEILDLEEKLLKLKKENRQLRVKLLEADRHCFPVLDENIGLKNQQIIEELTLQIETLKSNESDSILWKSEVDSIKSKYTQLEKDYKTKDVLMAELQSEMQRCKDELLNVQKKCDDTIALSQTEFNVERKKLDIKINQLETTNREQSTKLEALNMSVDVNNVVKKIMNNLYQKMQQEFLQNDSYSKDDVLMLTGQIIKAETIAALNRNENE